MGHARFSLHMSSVIPGDEDFASHEETAGEERQFFSGIAFVTSLVKLASVRAFLV